MGVGWLRQVAAVKLLVSGAGLTLGVCPNTTPRGLLPNTSLADELWTRLGAPDSAGSWSRGIAGHPLRSKCNTSVTILTDCPVARFLARRLVATRRETEHGSSSYVDIGPGGPERVKNKGVRGEPPWIQADNR